MMVLTFPHEHVLSLLVHFHLATSVWPMPAVDVYHQTFSVGILNLVRFYLLITTIFCQALVSVSRKKSNGSSQAMSRLNSNALPVSLDAANHNTV